LTEIQPITEPADDLYFEDHVPGSTYDVGSITVTEEDIIAFAKQWDPQVFHVDPEAAKNTSFGGLVASGFHTVVLAMRLIAENRLHRLKNFGSPGIDELRWLKPVRPGDTLSVRITVVDAKPSKSKPDRGLVTGIVEIENQKGETVARWKGMNIVERRNPGPPLS
jgi:acyl dehydratase